LHFIFQIESILKELEEIKNILKKI